MSENLTWRQHVFVHAFLYPEKHLIDHLIATHNMVQGFFASRESAIMKIFSATAVLVGNERGYLLIDLRFGASDVSLFVEKVREENV